ncbi:hypothetical protein C6Q34_10760, partial [Citrobacter freundii]
SFGGFPGTSLIRS